MADTDNHKDDDAIAAILADATPFLRALAQIIRRLTLQLDTNNTPADNEENREPLPEGE